MAAVPGRHMTASSLTLKLLFSSSLQPSAHPSVNRRSTDGAGLPQSKPLGFFFLVFEDLFLECIFVAAPEFKSTKSLLHTNDLSCHLQIDLFVYCWYGPPPAFQAKNVPDAIQKNNKSSRFRN